MKRSMLIGFAACAFMAMPAFTVSAMPIAPAHPVIDGADRSVILVKGGHGHGGWLGPSKLWPLIGMEPRAKSRLAWPGLPAWSLEARALLSRLDPGKPALLVRSAVSH